MIRLLQRFIWWYQDTVGVVRGAALAMVLTGSILFLAFSSQDFDRVAIVSAAGTFCAVIVALFPSRTTDRIRGAYTISRTRGGRFRVRCVIYNVGKTIVTMGNFDSSITDSGAIVIANIFDKQNKFVNILRVEMKKSQNRDFSSLRILPGMAQEYRWDNLNLGRGVDWRNIKIVVFTSTGHRSVLRRDSQNITAKSNDNILKNHEEHQNVV